MLAIGIERDDRIEVAQELEPGEQGVPLAPIGRERVHLHAVLARDLGGRIAGAVIHDEHVRRFGQGREAEEHLTQMGGGLIGRDQRGDLQAAHRGGSMRRSDARSSRAGEEWSGRLDLNQRPPAPHAGALPSCATPRPVLRGGTSKWERKIAAPPDGRKRTPGRG